MPKEYDIQIKALITIGGKYAADSMEEAIQTAKLELRSNGEISDVEIERAMYLDPGEGI